MYNKFLSYVIKNIRDTFEMTQKEFGEKIEKSEISIRKYESGEYNIPFTVLFIILKIFDIDIIFLKNIIDDAKIDLINNKSMTDNEIQECLEKFKYDISRIYKINIDKEQLIDFDSIDEIKAIFDNQLQEYIEHYMTHIAHDSVKYLFVIGSINKDLTAQIRKEIINFTNYNIEKLLNYMSISEEEFEFLEKNKTEELKKIAEVHKKLNSKK